MQTIGDLKKKKPNYNKKQIENRLLLAMIKLKKKEILKIIW